MATLSEQYKLAKDEGLLHNSVTEEGFVGILKDPAKRKEYYDYVQKHRPGFYSEWDKFNKNADDILAAAEVANNPTVVTKQTGGTEEEIKKSLFDLARQNTAAAKEAQERKKTAVLPVSEDDKKIEADYQAVDKRIKEDELAKVVFAQRGQSPINAISDEELDVLKKTRSDLEKKRVNYLDTPTSFSEAKDHWISAWTKNTDEGKAAYAQMEAVYREYEEQLLKQFKKQDIYKSIFADVQNKFNSGLLSEKDANKELNKRLYDAFIKQYKPLLDQKSNELFNGLAKQALESDNGWLSNQYDTLQRQYAGEAIAEGYDNVSRAIQKDFEAFKQQVGDAPGAGLAISSYIDSQQGSILGTALRLYQKADVVFNATKQGEGGIKDLFGEIFKNLGLQMPSIASFGVSDVVDAQFQAAVLKKIADAGAYDNPESVLSENEMILYDAIVASFAADLVRSNDTSYVADAGKIAADMIPFVIEIATGRAIFKGLTKSVQRSVSRGILRALGNGKWRRVLARATGEVMEGAVLAGTTAVIAPSTYEKMFQNEIKVDPRSVHAIDEGWTVDRIEEQSTGKALWDAYKTNFREIFTETGGMTQFAATFAKASPLAQMIMKSKVGQWANLFENQKIGQLFKQTAYHGIAQEMSEEWENTFYEAVGAFMNAEEGKRIEAFGNIYGEFASPETQVPMLIAFSIPAILGGGASAGSLIVANQQYRSAYNTLRDTFLKYGATQEQFEDALNDFSVSIMDAPLEQYPEIIRSTAAQLSGEDVDLANYLAAALSTYTVADANLGAIQKSHEKKQRLVQQTMHEFYAAEQKIKENTHTNTGIVHHVQMKGTDGQTGYVISGSLEPNQVVTVKMENGEVVQRSSNDFEVISSQPAVEAIEYERRRLTAKMNGMDRFKVGDVIYMTKDGQPIDDSSSRVVGVTDEGVEVEMRDPNGQPTTTVIPYEVAETNLSTSEELVAEGAESMVIETEDGTCYTLQKTNDGDWLQVAPATEIMAIYSAREIDDMINRGKATVVGGNVMEQEAAIDTVETTASEEQVETPQDKSYPVDEEGKLDWGQMDVPTATEAAIEKFGDKNTAKEYAELQIAQAKKAVAAANKKKATSTDADEFVAQKNAIRQEQQAAQAELSKWENILLGIANYKTDEEQAAAEQAAAQAAAVRAQRKQTIEGVGGTNMAERLAASPRIDGNAGSITAADGTKIPGHYVLVSANALTPSHNPNANFAPSEGYPTVDGQSINDRDYQADQEEQAKVQQVAQTYDGRAITNMPIVSDEGLVYSGNGRTMAGQLAAANGTDGAYTEALLENATQFGFTAEQVESVPNARVVFMTDERLPYNTTTLALFNQNEQQTQSNTASAAANVRKLTPEAVGHIIAAVQEFDTVDAFFGDSRAPFELVNRLIADGIISERDKAAFVDNGRLTATGKDRLTALLFGTAFDEKTIRLLGDNAKVRNSVMRALPQILENKGLGDFSLFEHINNAIAAIYDMDTNKMSFFEFTRQIDIEGKTASDKYTAFELRLVDAMTNGGVQAFRDILSGFNTRAKESAGGQMDLFTGEVLTIEELTKQILQEYEQREANERGGAQPELAESGVQEGDGEIGQVPANLIQGTDMTADEVVEVVKAGIADILEEQELSEDVEVVSIEVIGSRSRGEAKDDSDLDILLYYKGDIKEDTMFNALNPNEITINGISVDINPIRDQESGDPKKWHKRDDAWREQDRETTERTPRDNAETTPVQKSVNIDKKAQGEEQNLQTSAETMQKSANTQENAYEKAQNVNEKTQKDFVLSKTQKTTIDDSDLQAFAEKLGAMGVHVVSSEDQLPKSENKALTAINDGVGIVGWWNPANNQVYIYTPNINSRQKLYSTLLHEFVSHRGLREVLGQKEFNILCGKVWNAMSNEDKLQYSAYIKYQLAVRSNEMNILLDSMSDEEKQALLNDKRNQLAAADEYMAHLAETGVSETERSVWQKICDWVREALRKIGIDIEINDNDIANLLRASSKRLSTEGSMRDIADTIYENKDEFNGLEISDDAVIDNNNGQAMFSIGNNKQTKQLNAKQEKTGQDIVGEVDDTIRYSISKNNRGTIENWLAKREDLTEQEKNAFFIHIEEEEPMKQLATGKWFANGAIRLPEDQPTVDDAIKHAKKMKVDPLSYAAPAEITNEYRERFGKEEEKTQEELLSPDDARFEGKLTNKVDYGNGLVVYDVLDNAEGQDAVRELMNDHLGKEFNCWCLLYANADGKVNKGARDNYWKRYSGTQKKVAFYNGKITAFCASESNSSEWWDLSDKSHYGKIPVRMPYPNDSMGRMVQGEFTEKDGFVPEKNSRLFRGSKKNGMYEEWYNEDTHSLALRENYKGGKKNGIQLEYHPNGVISSRYRAKDDKKIGVHEGYHENGTLNYQATYVNGKKVGIAQSWYNDGKLSGYYEFSNDADGVAEIGRKYYYNGLVEQEFGRNKPTMLWESNGLLEEISQNEGGNYFEIGFDPVSKEVTRIDLDEDINGQIIAYRKGGLFSNARKAEALSKLKESKPEYYELYEKAIAGELDQKDTPRYSIGTQVVPMGDNTLVGLHNLSATKLRKAIKQGGLANPSVAVINMAIQDHEQYGDITLVMPSSMIDSTTGRNAGTYTGDIWSPTYPYVERKMSSKGSDKYYDALNKAFEGKHSGVKSRTAVIFVNMLDNQGNPDNLAYWYMLEKGIDPTDVIINSGISDDIKQRFEPLIDKRFASDLTTEERELLLGIAAELEGKTTEELLQAAQEAKKRYEDTVLANEKASQFSKNIALSAIDEIDTYGVRLNVLSDAMRRVREAIDKDGGVDVNATISAAVDYVQANGLKDDFDAWLDNLDDRFDIEEVIFDGYTRDGDRKYVKNTIANASRLMNQQPIQNATSHGGLSATRGQLVERMSTLAQIRANKHRLAAINEYEDEQWKAMQDEWFNEIINPLSEMQKINDNTFINMDIAEQRLLEAIMEKDPIAYLNREYRYKIEKDSKFAKALKDLMDRLKALPSKYFETKFKRPVMLNEFVSAVVPQDLPQDLKDSLKEAGLDVYEYNDTEGSRREATIEATNGEGVRFRIVDNHLSVEENENLIENNLHNSKKNSTFVAEMVKLIESDTVSAQEVKQFIDKVRNGRKEKTLQMGRLRMDGTSRGNDLSWCGAVIGEAVVLHQEKSGVSSQSSLLGSNLFIEVAKQLNAFTDYNEFVKGLGVPIGQGQEAIVWVKDDDGDVVKALHYNALLRDNTQQLPAIIESISWFNHLFPENQLSLNQVLGLHNNNLYVEVTQDYVDGEHPNFEDWGEVGAFINQMKAKGFEATIERGGEIILYKDNFEVRDLVGRNVIKDEDEVFHVIDANISQEVKEKPEIRFSIKDSESEYNPKNGRTLDRKSAREMADIKASAERNGTYLEAPNGADTNLTSRQWLQVRTRAFKKWFGDWENDADNASKILDENGEPMVVYHGTPRYSRKRFFAFNPNNGAAWFTPAKRYAEVFAESDQDAISTLYETYISIHNPANVGDIDMEVTTDRLNTLAYGLSIPLAELEECVSKVEDVTYLWNLTQSKPFADLLKKYGYDGIQAREAGVNSYGVFTPNQIKSATENVGTFDDSSDDIRFRISNENQRIFVSNAEKAVEGIKQEKATPQQWLAMLEKNGGIKAGEDKWLGLSEWLKEQDKKSITKQEILDFISKNQIQIEEVAYSAKPKNEVFEQYKQEYRDYYFEAQDNGAEDPQDVAWNRMLEEHGEDFGLGFWAFGSELQVDEDSDYTNWEYENETNERPINETRLDYTTEGLENKREIALTVPTIESWNENDEIHFGDAGEGRAIAWVRFGETTIVSKPEELLHAEKESKDFSLKMIKQYGFTYTESDMSDSELQQQRELADKLQQAKENYQKTESNILVIDEIQSKRHQEGREKGYVNTEGITAEKQSNGVWHIMKDGALIAPIQTWQANTEEEAIEKYVSNQIPDAPFDKNWHELAMKRMLRYAAENGYDYVAWTTGAQQADRYNIGDTIESLEASDWDINTYISPNPTKYIEIEGKESSEIDFYVDKEGRIYAPSHNFIHEGDRLSDVVGKELAVQILQDGHQTFDPDNARIGGEGMKGFYDKMLPSFVNKYVKKWGAKVGEVTMPQLQEGYQTMHSVDITPEMRESVMEGQTMFRISSDKNDVQNVATEIWNKYQYDGELESMRDVAEYAEEHMPKNAQTQALFDAIDAYRIEAEEDRMYYGMRGDLEPFEDAIMDEVERLMNATTQSKLTESEQLTFDALQEVAADAGLDVTVGVSQEEALKAITQSDEDVEPSIRTKPAPKKTGIGYKVFYRGKDGKLYPPMVANPNGADTPIGVWLDADAAPMAGESKTGRPQVKAGGKGTQGGSGTLAYRPGWHLGEIPYALQFNRKDETGERTLFPKDFVWAEVEYADDVNYQEEAESYGYTENGKYRHSYAGLPRVPENGSYRYRTNPNPLTDPWIITGAMKVNRVLTKEEVDEIVRKAGREPQPVELLVNPINGTILGYAQGNSIVLTREGMNPETMVHEYTHIWAKAMQRKNRAGWENIKQIFRESPLWNDVVNDPNYQGLKTDDAICSEVLARYSGKYGAERLDEVAREMILEEQQSGSNLGAARVRALINRARTAIKSFWKWVGKNLFGITKFDSQEDVADRVLYDLLNATDLDAQNNKGAAEKSMERPSPEHVEAMKAWNAANPYPTFEYGQDVNKFGKHIEEWKNARDKYRRSLLSEAIKDVNDADPITEPLVALEKPQKRDGETTQEFAQRLKRYHENMIDQKLAEEYNAEINRMASNMNKAKRAFMDAALPIEEWQKWLVERGAKIDGNSNAYQDTFLANGRVSDAAEGFKRDILKPLANKIANIIKSKKLDSIVLEWSNIDVPGTKRKINGTRLTVREILGVYCQAKDCEEAETNGLPDRGKEGFKKNLSGATYEDIINLVESRLTSTEIQDLWYYIRKATKFALEYDFASGRITEDTYVEFSKRDYYVPQRGWRERDESGLVEEYEPVGKRGHDPYNAALVKARGRQSLAADPFAYIMSIGNSSIISSENNKVKQKMLEFCLKNEEIGLKTGAFRVKKYWLMHEIDPNTGKIRKDENGNPIVNMSYTAPTEEQLAGDKKLKEQIKRIKKDIAKANKQIQAGVGPKIEVALGRSIARWESQIQDLEDQIVIAWTATNTNISQRTRDEKLQHEVQVLKDGQRYVIELQDEKVANAINKKFKQHQEALFDMSGKIRNATRFMSAMLTQYNPEFALSNFARDFQVAVSTIAIEHPELLGSYLKNFAMSQRAVIAYAFNDKVRDRSKFIDNEMGRYLKEYLASGAPTGFSYMQDLKSLRQDFDKMINEGRFSKGVSAAAGMFSMLTEISETTTRFSAYVAARKNGWSINDAAYMSKELTTNFDRAGEKADSAWMSWFSFFRATINGNIKFFRAFKAFPIGYSIMAALYFAAGMANQWFAPDDPDKELYVGDFTRQTNFIFGKWRLPAAHFMRRYFSAGVNFTMWMQDTKSFGHAAYDSAALAFGEIFPSYLDVLGNFSTYDESLGRVVVEDLPTVARNVAPTTISPIVDVYANRNFMGSTINKVPFALNQENTKDILLAKDNTLPIYKAITEGLYTAVGGDLNSTYKLDDDTFAKQALDISGSSVEHIVEGYFTGGMDLLATIANMIYDATQGVETTPDKIAFVRKFYNKYSTQNAYDREYFKLRGTITAYKQTIADYEKKENKAKIDMVLRSKQYQAYKDTYQLLERVEEPTAEDVKVLMEANKKWIRARRK